MKQVDTISLNELSKMTQNMDSEIVKAVVDVKRRLLVVDADLHVDEEQYLLENGSCQADLWGINLYPDYYGEDAFVEFDSTINIRPSKNNRSRSVEDRDLQLLIREIVAAVVYE